MPAMRFCIFIDLELIEGLAVVVDSALMLVQPNDRIGIDSFQYLPHTFQALIPCLPAVERNMQYQAHAFVGKNVGDVVFGDIGHQWSESGGAVVHYAVAVGIDQTVHQTVEMGGVDGLGRLIQQFDNLRRQCGIVGQRMIVGIGVETINRSICPVAQILSQQAGGKRLADTSLSCSMKWTSFIKTFLCNAGHPIAGAPD